MPFTEVAVLVAVISHSIAMLISLIKLTSWASSNIAVVKQRLDTLENQVNNDITGRKAVGEMRQDIAAIKAQINDIRENIKTLKT